MKAGREFEKIVYEFAKAISPEAEVFFDHWVVDVDTGVKRQCDVWIEVNIGGHFPLSILVSCKDVKRKLDVTYVEHFISEVKSTGATTGVLYSTSGFYDPAITKAQKNGIQCCRYYKNQPLELPEKLFCGHHIVTEKLWVEVNCMPLVTRFKTYGDIFNLKIREDLTVYGELERRVEFLRKHARQNTDKNYWDSFFSFREGGGLWSVSLYVRLAAHRPVADLVLCEGSYSYKTQEFMGRQETATFMLDGQGSHGWELDKEYDFSKAGLGDPKERISHLRDYVAKKAKQKLRSSQEEVEAEFANRERYGIRIIADNK